MPAPDTEGPRSGKGHPSARWILCDGTPPQCEAPAYAAPQDPPAPPPAATARMPRAAPGAAGPHLKSLSVEVIFSSRLEMW